MLALGLQACGSKKSPPNSGFEGTYHRIDAQTGKVIEDDVLSISGEKVQLAGVLAEDTEATIRKSEHIDEFGTTLSLEFSSDPDKWAQFNKQESGRTVEYTLIVHQMYVAEHLFDSQKGDVNQHYTFSYRKAAPNQSE